jgi:ArsR family metal-binding transcriptional regulator
LEESEFFQNQKLLKDEDSNKEHTTYEVRADFTQITNLTQHLPCITDPDKYNEKGVTTKGVKATKKIAQGSSRIGYSRDLVEFLNIASTKKMILNQKAISLIKEVHESGKGPILNLKQVESLKERLLEESSDVINEKRQNFHLALKDENEVLHYKKNFFLSNV